MIFFTTETLFGFALSVLTLLLVLYVNPLLCSIGFGHGSPPSSRSSPVIAAAAVRADSAAEGAERVEGDDGAANGADGAPDGAIEGDYIFTQMATG